MPTLRIAAIKYERLFVSFVVVLALASALADSCLAANRRRNGARQTAPPHPRALELRQQYGPYGPGGLLPRKYTQEDFNRWAKIDAPKRMTSAQLNPKSGRLTWPRVLFDPEYDEQRRALDRLFKERAQDGGAIDNQKYYEILASVEQMQRRLLESVSFVNGPHQTRAYIQARNFLLSLAYETDFVTPPDDPDGQEVVNLERN